MNSQSSFLLTTWYVRKQFSSFCGFYGLFPSHCQWQGQDEYLICTQQNRWRQKLQITLFKSWGLRSAQRTFWFSGLQFFCFFWSIHHLFYSDIAAMAGSISIVHPQDWTFGTWSMLESSWRKRNTVVTFQALYIKYGWDPSEIASNIRILNWLHLWKKVCAWGKETTVKIFARDIYRCT